MAFLLASPTVRTVRSNLVCAFEAADDDVGKLQMKKKSENKFIERIIMIWSFSFGSPANAIARTHACDMEIYVSNKFHE